MLDISPDEKYEEGRHKFQAEVNIEHRGEVSPGNSLNQNCHILARAASLPHLVRSQLVASIRKPPRGAKMIAPKLPTNLWRP